MSAALAAWIALGISGAVFIGVSVGRLSVPIWASVTIAAAFRVVFTAISSQSFTPNDVRTYFRATGELVLHGEDPLVHLPGREWNFLPLMPYVHALEIKTDRPWVYAVKIAPILADLVVVWLVAELAHDDGRLRALQYAVNPLSLLVVSLHGQVEPVALALSLGGLLAIKRNHACPAGLLFGLAIAAKTWPIIIAVAAIPLTKPRRSLVMITAAVIVPALVMSSGVLFLDTRVGPALGRLVSYQSFVRSWTWSGTLVATGDRAALGYHSNVGRLGTALVVLGVATALIVFRHTAAEMRAAAAISAALLCTAGFGPQYLLWPLPLLIALGGRARIGYTLTAAFQAAAFYLAGWANPIQVALSWLTCVVLFWALGELWTAGAVPPTGMRIGSLRRRLPPSPGRRATAR